MRRTGGLLETGKILYLPAAQIRPNPGQPRKIFDPAGLQELAGNATMLFYMTEEGQEGRNAFNQKRQPDFSKFKRNP